MAALAFVMLQIPFGQSHAIVVDQLRSPSAGHLPLVSLGNTTTRAGSRCTGTVPFATANGTLLGTTKTRGAIDIMLPSQCRGKRQIFDASLLFRAGAQYHAQIGFVSASWTANIGSVAICVAPAGHGCLSSLLTLTSGSRPPISTNNPVLISATSYGPSVTTVMSVAGTATLVLSLAISVFNATGGSAGLIQQDWVEIVVVQN